MKHKLRLLLPLFTIICFQLNAQNLRALQPDDFEKGLSKDEVQVLDVRTSAEYKNGHIKSAFQADWTNIDQFKERVQYLDKNKPVFVYCASGGRSSAAAKWLLDEGFLNVTNLKGGITAWKLNNKAIEGAPVVEQMKMDNYIATIQTSENVLVDFGAEWCPPCKKMEPVLKQLETELDGQFKLVKIDGGIHTALMQALEVDGLPFFIIYKNGKETWRKKGVVPFHELKNNLLLK